VAELLLEQAQLGHVCTALNYGCKNLDVRRLPNESKLECASRHGFLEFLLADDKAMDKFLNGKNGQKK